MKAKGLLVVSLLLNAVLAAAVLYFATKRPPAAISPVPAPETITPATTPSPKSKPATLLTAVTNQSEAFDWRQVESEDYRKYIANLRSIGCPEETIRDIIIADVNKLFEQRRRELTAGANTFQFWKSGNFFEDMISPERIEQTQALNKEKRALLMELLGYAPDDKMDFMAGFNPFERMLDFLPAGTQTEVMDIYMKYQARQAKLFEGGGMDEDSMKEMAKLQRQMDAELAALMSPKDYEEYQLRMSQTAMTMRMQLGSFDPDEQEFRDIFALRKQYDDEFGVMDFGTQSKEEREKAQAAQQARDAQIKALLGDARYAEYERAQDWNYQQLYRLTDKAGLPKESAVKVYDMKKTAETEARNIRNDKSLTQEQKTAALKAIRTETESAVQTVLGDKTWTSYQRQNSSYWLKSISPDERPAAPVPTPQD
ncbi:MAG TPA: hypothetical protein PKA41_11250 [Verrucomicrobiota bacterium]|nr:hypothetical protein [Verrucomicrobiota bacterium]